eukprot:TRINITY_DN710_c1_g1_i1.p1 TRINITY_DN710_c1_g1~~TRINITY_DN710_c1_g1_i1.p1  ORF type:complete len:185 (-),score=55.84 TRINITY_DN710_c1_g1_i1:226-780(-)
MSAKKSIKLVVIGDGAVGKTCLLISYAQKTFPKDYVPTVFDNYAVDITVGSQDIEFSLWDTAGQEEYDRLRPLSYANANVFLLCFSVISQTSYENVATKWHPELIHFCPTVPFILVGTKNDLRGQGQEGPEVTPAQGEELCKKLKAAKYMECSAKTSSNLKEVFDQAVMASLRPPKKSKGCILL